MTTSKVTDTNVTGSQFYKNLAGLTREEKENRAIDEVLSGNMPQF